MFSEVERKERLAYAISAAMRQRRLTPPKVAALLGKNADTIRRWAAGETTPSALDVAPLAEALGVDISYLVNPPPVPDYPIGEYLVETAYEGVQEGLDRAGRPQEPEAE